MGLPTNCSKHEVSLFNGQLRHFCCDVRTAHETNRKDVILLTKSSQAEYCVYYSDIVSLGLDLPQVYFVICNESG